LNKWRFTETPYKFTDLKSAIPNKFTRRGGQSAIKACPAGLYCSVGLIKRINRQKPELFKKIIRGGWGGQTDEARPARCRQHTPTETQNSRSLDALNL
jgi:hypothetical protein